MRLLGCLGIAILLFSFNATAWARKDPPESPTGDEPIEIRNPDPILSGDLVAGYKLLASYVVRDPAETGDFLVERWMRDSPRSWLKLVLYPTKTQQEAFDVAGLVYHARRQDVWPKGIDTPHVGSYSGQPIGDFCWNYRWTDGDPYGRNRAARNKNSSLVVVSGNNVFDVDMSAPDLMEDAVTEALAKHVVERLKTWQRPK